jgi:hypothetical protein
VFPFGKAPDPSTPTPAGGPSTPPAAGTKGKGLNLKDPKVLGVLGALGVVGIALYAGNRGGSTAQPYALSDSTATDLQSQIDDLSDQVSNPPPGGGGRPRPRKPKPADHDGRHHPHQPAPKPGEHKPKPKPHQPDDGQPDHHGGGHQTPPTKPERPRRGASVIPIKARAAGGK